MIRFLVVSFTVVFLLLFSVPIFALLGVYGLFNKKKKDWITLRLVQGAFKYILWLSGVELTVIGEERIPAGPVLFVANHRSQYDTLLTYSRVDRLTGYIAKKEMGNFPILRTRMKELYCLFLDRENPREGLKTILKAVEYLQQDISICIFPEGTRNKGEEGSLLAFKEGSFKIADKSNCPVVPIAITNAQGMFERQFPRMKKVKVIMEYCPPIYTHELSKLERKSMGAMSAELIKETLQRNMNSL